MKWMQSLALLTGSFLSLCASDGLPFAGRRAESHSSEDKVQLRDWLRLARVELPPFQVPVWILDHLGIHVNVTSCTCWHINVQQVQVPAAHGDLHRLRFAVDLEGLSIACSMVVNVKMFGRFENDIDVEVIVEDAGSTMGLEISSDGELPTAGTVEQCSLHFRLAPLRFEGAGVMPAALRAIESQIRYALEHSTGSICNIIKELMHKSVSDSMAQAVDYLRPLLKPAQPISWHSVPGAADLRNLFWSGPLGTLLRSGLREVAHTDDMELLNNFISELLLSFQLVDASMVWHLPNLARSLHVNASVPFTDGSVLFQGSMLALGLDSLNSFHSIGSSVQPSIFEVAAGISPGVAASGQAAIILPEGVGQFSIGGSTIKITESAPLAPAKFCSSCQTRVDGKLRTAALFDPHKSRSLQLDQLQRYGCLSHALLPANMSLGILEASVNATLLALQVRLPELDTLALEDQLLTAASVLAEAANATFGSTAVRLIAGTISGFGRDQMNSLIEQSLPASSETFCSASNFTTGHVEAIDYPARGGMVFCLMIAAVLAIRGLRPSSAQQSQNDPQENLYSEEFTSARSEMLEDSTSAPSELSKVALGCHPAVPPAMRTAMPWLLLGNGFLFVVAAFTPGTLVSVIATKPHAPEWMSPGVVVLSINNTLEGMWKSKVYLLWFLVVGFTVLWPYVKLAVMLHVWLRPMDTGRRGRILVFLDQVGKWSLADNFIMLLFIVFFHVSYVGPDTTQPAGEPSDGSTSIEIKCLPELEFYAFIVGTICSLVLGHAMLAAHRVAHGTWYSKAEAATDPVQPLWQLLPKYRAVSRLSSRLLVTAVTLALMLTLALVCAALFVPVVVLEFGGVIGTFLDVTGQPRRTWWSLASIAGHLVSPQHDLWLALVLAFFMAILPVLLHIFMLLLWLLPLRSAPRLRLFAACETFAAWSSLDVAAIAVLGAVIGGDNYGIAAFLNMVIYNGTVAPLCNGLRDGAGIECLTTHLELQATYWVLFAAAVASLAASQGIFRAVHVSQRERNTERTLC